MSHDARTSRGRREFDAAGVLLVGFAGTEVTSELRELVARGVLGVILFGRNVLDPAQVARLVFELKQAAGRPLLVAVDQEGGSVRRLRRGFSEVPSMRVLGEARDPALAHAVGRILGRELRAVGIDLDLAPVLDVDTNPDNPVIGERSFSSDPAWVAALGVALGRGLEWEGVAACAKHFPGHGDTIVDSHRALPRLPHDLGRLEAIELAPFRAWAQAGLSCVMTAHVLFDALDRERPATLSHAVISGLLRGQLGYEGVVLTDDLEMRAIADHEGRGAAAVLALSAGADVLLACSPEGHVPELASAIDRARQDDARFDRAFTLALERATRLAQRFARPPEPARLDLLDSAESRRLLAPLLGQRSSREVVDPTSAASEGEGRA